MKKSCYTLLLLCTVTFCFAQEKTTYINQRGEVHLFGPFDINELEEDQLYASWFNKRYDEFKLDDTTYSWSSELNDIEVDIYMGTWCGDSKKVGSKFFESPGSIGVRSKKTKLNGLIRHQ